MNKTLRMAIQYLVAPEDSRLGRRNYLNDLFLGRLSDVNRKGLEVLKVAVLMGISTAFMMVVAQL